MQEEIDSQQAVIFLGVLNTIELWSISNIDYFTNYHPKRQRENFEKNKN